MLFFPIFTKSNWHVCYGVPSVWTANNRPQWWHNTFIVNAISCQIRSWHDDERSLLRWWLLHSDVSLLHINQSHKTEECMLSDSSNENIKIGDFAFNGLQHCSNLHVLVNRMLEGEFGWFHLRDTLQCSSMEFVLRAFSRECRSKQNVLSRNIRSGPTSSGCLRASDRLWLCFNNIGSQLVFLALTSVNMSGPCRPSNCPPQKLVFVRACALCCAGVGSEQDSACLMANASRCNAFTMQFLYRTQ